MQQVSEHAFGLVQEDKPETPWLGMRLIRYTQRHSTPAQAPARPPPAFHFVEFLLSLAPGLPIVHLGMVRLSFVPEYPNLNTNASVLPCRHRT